MNKLTSGNCFREQSNQSTIVFQTLLALDKTLNVVKSHNNGEVFFPDLIYYELQSTTLHLIQGLKPKSFPRQFLVLFMSC